MSDQFVYFIQADENGPIKIGFTSDDPLRRLNQLQTGNASALRLVGAIRAARALERELHIALAEWRMQGEWFQPHPTVVETIQKAMAEAEQTLYCSFCGLSQHETHLLIAGPVHYTNICDSCVDLCSDILVEHAATLKADTQSQPPLPIEIGFGG